jgi:small acid-soluble spore protein E (minor gamma-type SASP)
MAKKNFNNFGSKTDAQKVRQQNQGAEFGSETDVQEVRRQNQQAEANKQQASGRANNFESR